MKLKDRSFKKVRQLGFSKVMNGEIPHGRSSVSPGPQKIHQRQGSVALYRDDQSVASSVTTALTSDHGRMTTQLTPQQFGVMGMEALETAIGYWEDALAAYVPSGGQTQLALTDPDEGKFTHQLEKVVEEAYKLQELCSQLFLYESSVLFRADSVTSERPSEYYGDRRTLISASSADSFVSAHSEVADISDFDEFMESSVDLQHLALYQTGLKQFESGNIPYRILRTEAMNCQSDIEFLAKVHCLRLGFQFLLEKEDARTWFANAGGQLLNDLLWYAERDPKDCLAAYDDLLDYVNDQMNWKQMEEELQGRGVKCLSFYDVVLDFILLDAFDDLENPPSSVLAVVQNRWLSSGFKETALATAVWSVLKAKRQMLKFPNGFIAHFYGVSEHLSPVLAWGFLGPNEQLKQVCLFFKDEVLGFLRDIFNFGIVRYTKVEDIAADIAQIAGERYDRACQRLSL